MTSSASDAFADIQRGFELEKEAGAYDAQLDEIMADEIVPYWKENSPVLTGHYRDSVQVTQQAKGGKGEVGATDEAANIIEFGDHDVPEYAPRAKTEAHFNHSGDVEAL